MTLSLEPLAKTDLSRVAHIRVAPDQIRFAGTVAEAFATHEPNVDFHAIIHNTTAVGFFKIDCTYPDRHPFADKNSLGLRAFIIDLVHQGKGLGQSACRALPTYLAQHYPNAAGLYITVYIINLTAIRAYARGGFRDTGQIWPHGDAGPQNVLHFHLAK